MPRRKHCLLATREGLPFVCAVMFTWEKHRNVCWGSDLLVHLLPRLAAAHRCENYPGMRGTVPCTRDGPRRTARHVNDEAVADLSTFETKLLMMSNADLDRRWQRLRPRPLLASPSTAQPLLHPFGGVVLEEWWRRNRAGKVWFRRSPGVPRQIRAIRQLLRLPRSGCGGPGAARGASLHHQRHSDLNITSLAGTGCLIPSAFSRWVPLLCPDAVPKRCLETARVGRCHCDRVRGL
jgi:hypothetical protein